MAISHMIARRHGKFGALLQLFLLFVVCCNCEHSVIRYIARARRRHQSNERLFNDVVELKAPGRRLFAQVIQTVCLWKAPVIKSSSSNVGSCDLNGNFVLSLPGRLPSDSARILAHLQYKASVCTSYRTEPDCYRNNSEACSWGPSYGCYLSPSAAYDPEVLRGRLYCPGSLLDVAARCALRSPQSPTGCSGGSAAGAGDPDCVLLSQAELQGLSAAAKSYVQLAALATYSSQDSWDTSGQCVARWITQEETLSRLQATVAARTEAGLLQADLVGECGGVAQLVGKLTALMASCAAPPTSSTAEACNADSSCRWEAAAAPADAAASNTAAAAAGGACGVDDDILYDILYGSDDSWVAALREAADMCAAQPTRAACETAGGTIEVDLGRMDSLRDALQATGDTDLWEEKGSGGKRSGGAVTMAGSGQWKLAVMAGILTTGVLVALQHAGWRL